MTGEMMGHVSLWTAVLGVAGVALGFVYFGALQRNVTLLVMRTGWRGPVFLTVARIAAVAGVLGLAAKSGAPDLFAAFAGFMLARGLVLRWARRVA